MLLLLLFGNIAFQNTSSPVFYLTDNNAPVGSIAVRYNIKFSDKCWNTLKASSNNTLDSVFQFLKKNTDSKIEVRVHEGKPCKTCTDCSPSRNGAAAIKNYLVKKGIDSKRIGAAGYGMTMPLSDKPIVNQRVEFKIIFRKI